MTYLLDTNACIALINGRPAPVRDRFKRALEDGYALTTSSIVEFELRYGVVKSSRRDENERRLDTFFAGPIVTIPFESEDARQAGEIRAALERAGTPLGAYDLLIAGHATQRNATLVTANVSEFARVANLRHEDWATTA